MALESTIITHGLPRPDNLTVAASVEQTVQAAGAIPATIALLDGYVHVGLSSENLARLADSDDVKKCSVRDLGNVLLTGHMGSTTVAATAHIAHRVGIQVFATGGLGGVHREARESWDESADLQALARLPLVVVCSGVKSILDVPATLERLETLGVGLCGFRTDQVPGFYLRDSGHAVGFRLDSPEEIAALHLLRQQIKDPAALVVLRPVDAEFELSPNEHDHVLTNALAEATSQGITGKEVTPFLLEYFHRMTAGRSLAANIALIRANAGLAANIATAMMAAGANATPGRGKS